MKYTFTEALLQQGTRYFIKVPFPMSKERGSTGFIMAKITIENQSFECKLIPKGKGMYVIPVPKKIKETLHNEYESISLEVIEHLTRIKSKDPYTKEHPIANIDPIKRLTYPKPGYCGQLCLAMLTGKSVEDIISITQAKAWQCSMSKVMETLDHFGIPHDEKMTYTKGKQVDLPNRCIVNVRAQPKNHLVLYDKGIFYDTIDVSFDDIIGYLGIHVS